MHGSMTLIVDMAPNIKTIPIPFVSSVILW
jgi:hypothetical protein